MKFCGIIVFGVAVSLAATMLAQAQPAAPASLRVSGTVTAVDAASQHLSMKSDKGEEMTVDTTERTVVLRIPPGETDVKKASKIAVSDLAAGDRIVAVSKTPIDGQGRGRQLHPGDEQGGCGQGTGKRSGRLEEARHHRERHGDRRGGQDGDVESGIRTLTVKMSDKTEYHRYSLDSARFSDASPSAFADDQAGRPDEGARQ